MVARLARSLPGPGPLRRIAAGTLASSVGNGAWYTSWAIFLTHSVGLSPGEIGVGMTAAGAMGVLASTPVGRLADRAGARRTFRMLLLAQAAASMAFAGVTGMASFVVVASVAQIADSSTGGPRNAFVLELCGENERLAVLGHLRAISHVGWALGAAVGGVAISLNTRPAYLGVLALNGVSYLVYAWLAGSGPGRPAGAAPTGASQAGPPAAPPRMTVLADRPYVSLAALMGVLALCWAMLSTGVPLWVTLHTHAPRAISATVVLISALAIAALQVPANRGMRTPQSAGRGALLAGVALAGSCLLFAATAGLGGWPAIALMLGATALHVTGELLFVAASWGLSVPLMPPDAAGEYRGRSPRARRWR